LLESLLNFCGVDDELLANGLISNVLGYETALIKPSRRRNDTFRVEGEILVVVRADQVKRTSPMSNMTGK
jgi:hypothetical protein